MAPGVLVTGQGTYSYGPWHFRPGFTPCDDENVLNAVQREGLRWVEVVDQPAEAQYPSPEEIAQAEAKNESAASGPMTKADLKRTGYACRAPDCGKVLANAGGRATHERVKHPDFVPPEDGGDS